MSGRWGRSALAEDAAGVSRSKGAKSKLSSSAEHALSYAPGAIDQLSRELKTLVKEYGSLDETNDFGRSALKKIEKVFDRADRLRGIYQSVY